MKDGSNGKRPRIQKVILTPIVDPLEYKENLCSPNARQVTEFNESINIHFWIDKHYSIRNQIGDDDGKREGIGMEFIEPLISKSFSHLIFYSSKHQRFAFANYNVPKNRRTLRIVLKEIFANEVALNVIVEYHYKEHNCYEVTVKTAMRKDNFVFGVGDYAVQITGETSELILNDRGNYRVIDNYER